MRQILASAAVAAALLPLDAAQVAQPVLLSRVIESRDPDHGYFGHSIDIHGGRAVVGSPTTLVEGAFVGSAYVFNHDGTQWLEQDRLLGGTVQEGARFGWSVAIHGDTIAVGQPQYVHPWPYSHRGAVRIFEYLANHWHETQAFLSDAGWSQLGTSVALSERYLVVGAPYEYFEGETRGAVHVYRRVGNIWVLEQRLRPPETEDAYQFGWSVATRAAHIVVGSPAWSQNKIGSAYVFERVGARWQQIAQLQSDPPIVGFGWSVSLSPSDIAVGAPWPAVSSDRGAVYVYSRQSLSDPPKRLLHPEPLFSVRSWETLGRSVSLDGDSLLCGPHVPVGGLHPYGASYLFQRDATGWTAVARLRPRFPSRMAGFGAAVAMDNGLVLCGAPAFVAPPLGGDVFGFELE